ncbi:MAG: hypothetical protein ABEH38_04325 [Flavobacteriales bacterium]
MQRQGFTLSLLILFVVSLTMTSCKYEEGPFISLRSKKERVANTWKYKKIIRDNGDEITGDNLPDTELTFTKDGDYKVNGNEQGNWEFGPDKEKLILKDENGNDQGEADILKLKEKELWIKNEQGDEYHFEPA